MRICYVSHSDAHFIVPYVDYFSRRGDEVHLISLHQDDLPGAIMHHPVRGQFDPMKDKFTYFWAQFPVRKTIRRIAADVVHAHYLTSNAFMAAMAGCRPLVVSARGSDVHQSVDHRVRRRIIRYTMNRADLVNPVSRDLERKILALGIPASKIVRLTQGIHSDRFTCDRGDRRPGPVRILCTRKLFPIYQADRIIRAAGILTRRGLDFELTFAATGPKEPELREQVRAAGLDDHVRFLGGFRNADLPPILADADIYVSASLWDGTSPALLEAMASGAFPVVSDITANREWLTGEGDGLFFDPASDDELAAALARAIGDDALRRRAIDVNRKRVRDEGDTDTNLARLAEHYERLTADRA
jgi:glycosyltransferase involved in cell wall biosynthesis